MNEVKFLVPEHIRAHNALSAVVELYQGVLRDYEQRLQALTLQCAGLKAKIAVLEKHAVQERSTTTSVPREGSSGRDQRRDGGALGEGNQGQEAPGEEEQQELSRQVG